ncbi:MAG: 1-phosphofructokinase [Ruminococcus sp.]|nr:1-phosphofructokinase [Ruminococcus sp.]
MIYTVTLNPSIDYVVHLDSLAMGITNRTTSEEYFYGGKGINVSCVLSELGFESTALGFIAGFTGDAIESGLKNMGIKTDFIKTKNGISRINIKIKADEETEINCQGPEISEDEINLLINKIHITDNDILILAGNAPKSIPDTIYENILKHTSNNNIKVVVDASKSLLLNTLKYKPFLIKPNLQELCELFGKQICTEKDTILYAKKLQQMGAKNVLVSMGSSGAILIDENGITHKSGTIDGKIINTVGSGDSMVAGFIAGYEQTKSYAYALKLGTACGNATAFSNGLATKQKIEEILPIIN